jgi:general secretion pathway protein D
MRTKAAALLLFLFVALIAALSHGAAKSDKISLNFDDVDLAVFLKTMSEITGKSFVLTEKVRGKVSFVSTKEVPADKVYDVVLSILKAQGWSAVQQENNVIQIFPTQEALKTSGKIYYGTEKLEGIADTIVTQIIPLQFSNAGEVMNIVRPIFASDLLIAAYPVTNVVIVSGPPPSINLVLTMVAFLDTQIPTKQSDIHIYNLENSDAETIAKTLSALASSIPVQAEKQAQQRPPGGETSFFSERFRVVASKDTNSIIIISAPQDYEKIMEVVRELDLKRQQVLVEVLILEITLSDDRSFGVDWRALVDTGYGVDAIAQSNTGLVTEGLATGGLAGLTVGLLNGTIPSVYAILNANRDTTNFKILSTPQLVTVDNNEATISIGEQIPFLTSSRVDQNNNVVQTFDYKDVGIDLKLTPHVNKNGYITMEIKQQIKKIVEATATLVNPSVYNRQITSRVTVKDERTIVLGGLIRDDVTMVETKVPLLGDIPLLGAFFKTKAKETIRTNLMVFITPHLITDDQSIVTLTDQRKKEQAAFEEEYKKTASKSELFENTKQKKKKKKD